jgi:hypothetical protein
MKVGEGDCISRSTDMSHDGYIHASPQPQRREISDIHTEGLDMEVGILPTSRKCKQGLVCRLLCHRNDVRRENWRNKLSFWILECIDESAPFSSSTEDEPCTNKGLAVHDVELNEHHSIRQVGPRRRWFRASLNAKTGQCMQTKVVCGRGFKIKWKHLILLV